MNEPTTQIGQNLRKMRKKAGLTQQQASEKAGLCNNTSLVRIEATKTGNLYVSTLIKLCEVYDCELSDIVKLKNDKDA